MAPFFYIRPCILVVHRYAAQQLPAMFVASLQLQSVQYMTVPHVFLLRRIVSSADTSNRVTQCDVWLVCSLAPFAVKLQ